QEDAGGRQRVRREAGAREPGHRAGGGAADGQRVALLDAVERQGEVAQPVLRSRNRRASGRWNRISAAIPATTFPAGTASQKWFAVAITVNHTQPGQRSQSALAQR